eukprot:365940-Chlamydomonas_euryale.AAC.4
MRLARPAPCNHPPPPKHVHASMHACILACVVVTPAMSSGDRRAIVMQTVVSDDEAKMGALRDPAPRWVGNVIAWLLNLVRGAHYSTVSRLTLAGLPHARTAASDACYRAVEGEAIVPSRICLPPACTRGTWCWSRWRARALPRARERVDTSAAPLHPDSATSLFLPPPCHVPLKIGPKGLEFGKYSIDYHYIRNYLYVNRNWGSRRAAQHIPSFAKRIMEQYNAKGEVDARLALPKPPGPPGPFPKQAKR